MDESKTEENESKEIDYKGRSVSQWFRWIHLSIKIFLDGTKYTIPLQLFPLSVGIGLVKDTTVSTENWTDSLKFHLTRYPRQTARFQPRSARGELEMLMVMREIERSILESITNRASPFQVVGLTQNSISISQMMSWFKASRNSSCEETWPPQMQPGQAGRRVGADFRRAFTTLGRL